MHIGAPQPKSLLRRFSRREPSRRSSGPPPGDSVRWQAVGLILRYGERRHGGAPMRTGSARGSDGRRAVASLRLELGLLGSPRVEAKPHLIVHESRRPVPHVPEPDSCAPLRSEA